MRRMEKFFDVAGPCVAAKHCMLPAAERLPEVPTLIRRGLCFVERETPSPALAAFVL